MIMQTHKTNHVIYSQILLLIAMPLLLIFSISGCSMEVEDTEPLSVTIDSIEDFSKAEYTQGLNETTYFTVNMTPKDIALSDIIVEISNTNILSVTEQSIKNGWGKSKFSFAITTVGEGNASFRVTSSDKSVCSNRVSFLVEEPSKIEQFGSFKERQFELFVGDSQEFTQRIYPKGLLREDIALKISDRAVISVEEISFGDDEKATAFTYVVTALSPGQATLILNSADGKVEANALTFTVDIPPIIRSFGTFRQNSFYSEVGDTLQLSQHILPLGTLRENIILEISNENVISIIENSFADDEDATLFVYTVKSLSPGESTLILKSSDGKTESKPLTFIVKEKDTSRIVYVTPTGKRYHFSSACAGSNASSTTLNSAKASGYTPCKKCAS